MNFPRLVLCLLSLGLVCAPSVRAQYEMKSGVYNRLSQRVPANNSAHIPPVGQAASPTGDPTITPQYSNVVESSASSAAITTSTTPAVPPATTPTYTYGYPQSSGIKLTHSSLGTTFASGVPKYFYGDRITPPTSIVSQSGSVLDTSASGFWRAEPVRPGEILANPSGAATTDYRSGDQASIAALAAPALENFYYSPHARAVFANTPGNVEITWRSSVPDATNKYIFYKERFSVSSATATPVRTMYWTEKSFNGPRVSIPSGKIVTVNPVFSNVFPETVPEEYVVVGTSTADPNAEASAVLRTLWFEKANGVGELHAYNLTGRILVEYLGELQEDGSHVFLGLDIVNVERALPAVTATISLGEQILPYGELPTGTIGFNPDESLVGSPVSTTGGVDQVNYYGTNPRPDGTLAYYAERENDIEDRVTFYWLEPLAFAIPQTNVDVANVKIQWPKYLNKYLQVWPDLVDSFVINRVDVNGSSTGTGTGLPFLGGNIPQIIYQDSTQGDTTLDATTQLLLVDLNGETDQQNRTLLKFIGSNGGVWYVRLLTAGADQTKYKNTNDLLTGTATAYVGDRLVPPSSDLTVAGYVSAGTSYSPGAYINPFVSGVSAAAQGAIIPVNVVPGKNTLTVWWFKKTPAKSGEFTDLYTPAKIVTYTLAHRESTTVVSEDFDGGASGWTNNLVTVLSGTNKFLGSFGTYAVGASTNVAVNSPVTSKTFALSGIDDGGLDISFRLLRLDTWDNELFRVFVNDRVVFEQAYTGAAITRDNTGTVTISGVQYDWSVKREADGYVQLNGVSAADQFFNVSIHATPTTQDGLTSLASLKVGFGSNLNSDSSDESFGIDDFSIRLPVPEIVLASNDGTGVLSTNVTDYAVYNQPDASKVGYNPNEEHALLLGGRGYALRDDLNVTTGTSFTSLPRVLISYTDPVDARPSMKVYQVLRENQLHRFDYPVTAGTQLNVLAPMPLPKMPLPIRSDGSVANLEVNPTSGSADLPSGSGAPDLYRSFTFKDRKGYDWVYRGPHAGTSTTAALGMKYYYVMRSDFVVPGRTIADGTILPYLRPITTSTPSVTYGGDAVSGDSLTVVYRPVWPDAPPVLSVGETLTLPKNGLPAVRGQTSAQVLYQQSIANGGSTKPSVALHDPTRAKSVLINSAGVGLSALPPSLATTSQNGKTYFQLAQPHLQQRIYFNPLLGDKGGIELIGQFVDEVAGEDYLLLNTLSPTDVTALKGLVIDGAEGKTGWNAAIDQLSTKVETFKENPSKPGTYIADSSKTVNVNGTTLTEISDSDTAVDSYALTAKGQGKGYVSLLFGDGEAFTPEGEPVSVAIIQVGSDLYTGDLKAILASNPLDEQASIRHSGDYAARPDLFDFEWAYYTTTDGGFPAIYTYSTQMILGTGTTPATNSWSLLSNPTMDLGESTAGLGYTGATTVTLPRSLIVNETGYDNNTPKKYPAGKILKSTALNFTGEVPSQIIFSATSGINNGDGFVVYVNNVPALAYNIPAASPIPGNLPLSDALTGLVSTDSTAGGLTYQFQLLPSYFKVGTNTLEVALYSAQTNATVAHQVDFHVHALVKTDQVTVSASQWQHVPAPTAPTPALTNTIVVGGSAASPLGNPLLLFSDNYFTMRYKAKDTTGVTGAAYSEWSNPVLIESWVKRVLDGINPFNQRQTDLYNNPISTDVSILTQAGKRWEGDVALNLQNINSFGLIEIYETVLNRVKAQSIDAGIDDASVNNTLLLAAGYLNDLYMTLGHEAYDDALNPTIQIDGEVASSDISSARFSFEGQTATLIEETLGLLRGRDDFFNPGTKITPAYNRLYWNYTNGINSGEPIYAVNYNIKEKASGPYANGVLDASDAQYMFPQGHGDAYGHYLTALTGYYKLLTNAKFTWVPSTEAVSVLGQAVQVDYKDERKFAAAAAAVARAGVEIIDFTARNDHLDGEEHGWSHYSDGKVNSATNNTRNWGTDEWSSRVYQGAYFNWINANAMLPATSTKEGIQKIDRTTVPEINELVTSASDVLTVSSGLQAHLNTLGLPHDAMTFDISPVELAAGKSHFEQIYGRAIQASVNAKNAFHQAGLMNQLLRKQNNSQDEFDNAVTRQESAYEYELSTIFGTPYPGDVGPGKLYAQGYTGPDLYHYFFIDQPSTVVDTSQSVTVNFREPVNHDPFTDWSIDNVYNRVNDPVQYTNRTYTISNFSLGQFTPSGYGKRAQPGKLQTALLDAYQAQVNLREATNTFNTRKNRFDRAYQLYSELIADYAAANAAADSLNSKASNYANAATLLTQAAGQAGAAAEYATQLAEAVRAGIPTVTGPFAFDTAFVGRGIAKLQGAVAAYAEDLLGLVSDTAAAKLEGMAADLESEAQGMIDDVSVSANDKKQVIEFQRLYDDMLATSFEINRRMTELQQASEQVSRLLAETNHILSDRETFRQRAAAIIQGYRTRDVVYRDLRNEELSQYKSLFDLAQTYVYCAAKAYDYETGLLDSADGETFVNEIVGTYSLGDFSGNTPVASGLGDRGLAGILSDLNNEWLIVEGRLGINNPDRNGTVFSLRQELFRIPTDQPSADDNNVWKQVLQQHVMSNVLNDPDVAMYCNNISKANGSSVPGIVIPFGTTIQPGLNFFGWPLAGGDHAYSQSNFATKIYSSGLVFKGYIGMDPYAAGTPGASGPASSNPNALSATPYAYLIPAGVDHLLSPPLGDSNILRSWSVKDQALPLPKNLGTTAFSAQQFFTPQGSLNENLWIVRKHQAFRAVDDPVYFYGSMPAEYTNSRLVSRSVWNSQWKIVIPAYTLLNDEQGGLDRFIRSVTDIKLFFRTYSTSGN